MLNYHGCCRRCCAQGYLHLAYDSFDEALACRTTPKKFLWLPYVKGIVSAQGYAGLGEALDTYKPDKEFVVLASINMVRPGGRRWNRRCDSRGKLTHVRVRGTPAEQVHVLTTQGVYHPSTCARHASQAGNGACPDLSRRSRRLVRACTD